MIDDAQLIHEALNGNTVAFGDLVRKYQDRLFNTLLHVAGSREEAEDVVQEAFVQAFLKLSSFGQRSAFYTWLYRIAFNVSISRRRRKKNVISLDRGSSERGQGDQGLDPVDDAEMPDRRMLREERAGLVHAALATLSDEHRSILVLREIEGFDYEQISDVLDLPTGTVRSRLHRARLQLREQLKSVEQDMTS